MERHRPTQVPMGTPVACAGSWLQLRRDILPRVPPRDVLIPGLLRGIVFGLDSCVTLLALWFRPAWSWGTVLTCFTGALVLERSACHRRWPGELDHAAGARGGLAPGRVWRSVGAHRGAGVPAMPASVSCAEQPFVIDTHVRQPSRALARPHLHAKGAP